MTTLLFLVPGTPLLFMGQEFASTSRSCISPITKKSSHDLSAKAASPACTSSAAFDRRR